MDRFERTDAEVVIGDPTPSPSTTRLARSAGLIGIATMTSRVLGLARDKVLAHYFGAGDSMDAFNIAFRIPNLLRDLFAEGAMSSAFIPTFTTRLTRAGRQQAWRLGSLAANGLFVVTGVLVVLGIVFAEPLVRFLAAEYALVPGKLELTVFLTRLMLPFLTLIALAAVAMGMLNSLHRFFVPALSSSMFNIATILSAFAFIPLMAPIGVPAITAIAIGTLLGGLGQILIQWPVLRREGYRYAPVLDWRDEGLRRILLLMGPGTIGLAATEANLLVNTILATGEGTGAVSWLQYAFRLVYLPIGIFGVSVATAITPVIARHAADGDLVGMRTTLSRGLRLMLMLNVPATLGLAVLAGPIISVILEGGEFTAADTAATSAALMAYAPGLVAYSAVKLAVPTFYALGDARTPVAISVTSVLLNIAINVMLVRLIGYVGLAIGTSVAAWINTVILFSLLKRRTGGIEGRKVAVAAVKITLASLVMAAAALAVQTWLTSAWPASSLLGRALHLFAAIGTGVVVLGGAAHLLRIEELGEAVAQILGRYRGRRDTRTS